MVQAALQGDLHTARSLHNKTVEGSIAIFADGSPGGIKTMLNEMGLCETTVRPPLWAVNSAVESNLRRLASLGL
jgi:4-hydroxy-tetrahydrodipicolinate synthase